MKEIFLNKKSIEQLIKILIGMGLFIISIFIFAYLFYVSQLLGIIDITSDIFITNVILCTSPFSILVICQFLIKLIKKMLLISE